VSLVIVLRMPASTVLLWCRTPFRPRLSIAARLLIVAARLLFKTTLLRTTLLRLRRTLLKTTLLLWPALAVQPTAITAALAIAALVELQVSCRFLMLLELRPALLSTIVVELLRTIVALVPVETHGPLGRDHLRTSAIVPRVEVAVIARSFHVMHLHRGLAYVSLVHRFAFFWTWIMKNTIASAVERDTALVHDSIALYDGAVDVHIADVNIVHANDSGVVEEVVSAPVATGEANAHVSEAIVDAPVVSNMASPIPGMEDVQAA